ncbi:MAG TPA: GYD domain-containing protein [Pseudolabrys sp.]|nr:GYD domain-containing protein [Pseudolabrys sp.]
MTTFMMTMNFTDQGVSTIKDAPKRMEGARQLAKKMGVDIKQVYLTAGDSDLVAFLEASDPDAMPRFALALGSLGNVHTKTVRAWPEADFLRIVSELP